MNSDDEIMERGYYWLEEDCENCPHCGMFSEPVLEEGYLICEWCGECLDF